MDFIKDYTFQLAVITAVGYLFTQAKVTNKQYRATQAGVQALLRDRLISAIHKSKKQGFIYIHELTILTRCTQNIRILGATALLFN